MSDALTLATLDRFVGRELGVSQWVRMDQERIVAFGECTGDRQWIHVDPERASREGPFGGTIAPVPAGRNVRTRIKLTAVEAKGNGRTLVTTEKTSRSKVTTSRRSSPRR
jgi:acyl dehydratase